MSKFSDLKARWMDDPEFRAAYADVVEIERLRQECAEAYQVIGELAVAAGVQNLPEVIMVLDNLWAAAQGESRPHTDILPFAVPTLRAL